jgi:hypothetical protein
MLSSFPGASGRSSTTRRVWEIYFITGHRIGQRMDVTSPTRSRIRPRVRRRHAAGASPKGCTEAVLTGHVFPRDILERLMSAAMRSRTPQDPTAAGRWSRVVHQMLFAPPPRGFHTRVPSLPARSVGVNVFSQVTHPNVWVSKGASSSRPLKKSADRAERI